MKNIAMHLPFLSRYFGGLKVGFGRRGLLEKGSFQKSPLSRDSREFRDSRNSREPPPVCFLPCCFPWRKPAKLVLEGALYGTFPPPPPQIRYVLPPFSWQKVVYTPPMSIAIRLPFLSRCFCRSIGSGVLGTLPNQSAPKSRASVHSSQKNITIGFSKQGSTPTPWARVLRDQIPKGRSRYRNSSCIGFTVFSEGG